MYRKTIYNKCLILLDRVPIGIGKYTAGCQQLSPDILLVTSGCRQIKKSGDNRLSAIFLIARLDMILFNKLLNHNCTDQTAQAGLCLCCWQMHKTGFHMRGPFNVNLCFFGHCR